MFDPENDEQLRGDAAERAGSSVGVKVSQKKDNINVLPETRNDLHPEDVTNVSENITLSTTKRTRNMTDR